MRAKIATTIDYLVARKLIHPWACGSSIHPEAHNREGDVFCGSEYVGNVWEDDAGMYALGRNNKSYVGHRLGRILYEMYSDWGKEYFESKLTIADDPDIDQVDVDDLVRDSLGL